MRKGFKNKKGITLIALVVTIIVLLLLAGILIMMLTGNNGILQRAGEAKENSDKAKIIEKMQLAYLSALSEGKDINIAESTCIVILICLTEIFVRTDRIKSG